MRQSPEGVFGENPVDVTLSLRRTDGQEFLDVQRRREEVARALSPEWLQPSSGESTGTRYTFDINKTVPLPQRDINRALEAVRTSKLHREKRSHILNMSSAEGQEEARRPPVRSDVYGHRTAHADAVLGGRRLVSGLGPSAKESCRTTRSGFAGPSRRVRGPEAKEGAARQAREAWLRHAELRRGRLYQPVSRRTQRRAHPEALRDGNKFLDTKSPDEAGVAP